MSFSLTAFLLPTALERVGWVLLLSSPGAEQPETESDPWRGREGKEGRWGAAPMSAVSVLGAVLPLLPVDPPLPCHSEGESHLEGKKKRLGRNNSPQNGRFGGRATSCEGTEEQTIDQACILGGPDNSLLGPGRRGIS